jgi:DNA polymerase III epsilon subunit-like protein
MAERVLVFDVETTGLPVRRNRPYTETDNFPQVVQLAHRCNAEPVANVYLQTQRGIPPDAIKIHGVTNEFLAENGVEPRGALEAFLALVAESDVLVAHNFEFDSSVILAQAHGLYVSLIPHAFGSGSVR